MFRIQIAGTRYRDACARNRDLAHQVSALTEQVGALAARRDELDQEVAYLQEERRAVHDEWTHHVSDLKAEHERVLSMQDEAYEDVLSRLRAVPLAFRADVDQLHGLTDPMESTADVPPTLPTGEYAFVPFPKTPEDLPESLRVPLREIAIAAPVPFFEPAELEPLRGDLAYSAARGTWHLDDPITAELVEVSDRRTGSRAVAAPIRRDYPAKKQAASRKNRKRGRR